MNNVIKYGLANTPFGSCFYAETNEGVCSMQFTENGKTAFEELKKYWKEYIFTQDDIFAQKQLDEVFVNMKSHNIHVKGTEFQKKVWSELQNIPFAKLMSYSELSCCVGYPKAVRAVASAVASNRVAYLIPCHRIVRKNGDTGEFRWGKKLKIEMIEWENKKSNP